MVKQTKQTLKIMFFSWDNFYSQAIQNVTKCKWSHIGIAIENKDSYTVYEALSKGLVKSDYTKEFINSCISDGRVTIKETKDKYEEDKIKSICEKYIGVGYDFLAIFFIFIYSISKLTIKYDNVRNVFCSEFVARAGYDITDKKLNFEKELNKRYEYLSPADLFKSKLLRFYK